MNIECKNKSKPELLSGFGEINFDKQYRQGNRIYDSREVTMCLTSSPIGNTGGYSYLYVVEQNDKGGDKTMSSVNNKNNILFIKSYHFSGALFTHKFFMRTISFFRASNILIQLFQMLINPI